MSTKRIRLFLALASPPSHYLLVPRRKFWIWEVAECLRKHVASSKGWSVGVSGLCLPETLYILTEEGSPSGDQLAWGSVLAQFPFARICPWSGKHLTSWYHGFLSPHLFTCYVALNQPGTFWWWIEGDVRDVIRLGSWVAEQWRLFHFTVRLLYSILYHTLGWSARNYGISWHEDAPCYWRKTGTCMEPGSIPQDKSHHPPRMWTFNWRILLPSV